MSIPPPTPEDMARDLAAAYSWSVGESDDAPAPGLLPAVIRRLAAAEAAIQLAKRPLLVESDLIDFYKRRMADHRCNAIASRKRAEAAEAEVERLRAALASHPPSKSSTAD